MSISAKHYDLSQIYCHKYKEKLRKQKEFCSFSLTERERKHDGDFKCPQEY